LWGGMFMRHVVGVKNFLPLHEFGFDRSGRHYLHYKNINLKIQISLIEGCPLKGEPYNSSGCKPWEMVHRK